MKWSLDLKHHWKTFVTYTLSPALPDKNETGKESSDYMEEVSEDLDLKVSVNGTSQWKRWSVGSDTNGAYAKVGNRLDPDEFQTSLSNGHVHNHENPPTRPQSSSFRRNGDIRKGLEPDNNSTRCPGLKRCNGLPWASAFSSADMTIREFLLHDKWRVLFDKFDPEGFGEMPWADFMVALKSPEFTQAIEPGKLQILEDLVRHESQHSTAITFQHFVNIMSGKRTRSFKCALHHRDREVWSESDFHLLPLGYQPPSRVKRMARLIADEFLTDERDRKYYADHYRCLPPPLFIISVTLIELGFFTYYTVWHGEVSSSGPLPIDSIFVYRPDKRQEVWRFFFYMVLHAGWVHLMFNLLVQLLVGLPLEMVHGSLRIGCVYMAGVLAGSLGTSVFDPDVYLVGASGGVYALLAAHLANVLLNYNNMEFGLVRLLGVFLIASVDVGFAIYDRYAALPPLTDGSIPPVSYVAHLTGALAGLTIGLLVLKNFEQKLREQLMWWLALGIYGACTLFAILFNIFHPTYP